MLDPTSLDKVREFRSNDRVQRLFDFFEEGRSTRQICIGNVYDRKSRRSLTVTSYVRAFHPIRYSFSELGTEVSTFSFLSLILFE